MSEDDPVLVPQAKKPKVSTGSGLQEDSPSSTIPPEASIIAIDDVEDPREELLNKSKSTADILEFFKVTPRLPGQLKKCAQCKICE